MKKVIAIVGMPGAGKTLAAQFFKEKNIPVIRFGDITDEGLHALNLSLTQENEKPFREKLRKELGMAAYAIKTEPKIRATLEKHSLVVIDGLRSWEEYEYLSSRHDNIILLAIYASPALRYERLGQRKERSLDKHQSRRRDIEELMGLHMGPPIAVADYLIKNDSLESEFFNQLEQTLKDLS